MITPWEKVERILRDSDNKIVGSVRFQRLVYLLEEVGLGEGFVFNDAAFYPYSERLAEAISAANAFNLLKVRETYRHGHSLCVYTTKNDNNSTKNTLRNKFVKLIKKMGIEELNIVSTAVYLYNSIYDKNEIWGRIERTMPQGYTYKNIEKAQRYYKKILCLAAPKSLPII